MYKQGFGDCFLITFKNDVQNIHMLIDCGVKSNSPTSKNKMKKIMTQIKTDCHKLDYLVATHEHWDHLSGFLHAKNEFNQLPVDEIWMAWTEDPEDKFAADLKDKQKKKLTALTNIYNKLKKLTSNSKEGAVYLNAFDQFFEFYGSGGVNVKSMNSTAAAFNALRNHNSKKTYFEPSNEYYEFDKLPGIRVYVLGPPKNEKSLNKMNPSKNKGEVYESNYFSNFNSGFLSAASNIDSPSEENSPFDKKFKLSQEQSKLTYKEYYEIKDQWRQIENDWMYASGSMAIALDTSINNTSLVLAFEFIESGKVLLFVGDAQVGNWLSWQNHRWEIPNQQGGKRTIDVSDLLSRTVFYKVGHHGSHNSTLKELGLEKMNHKDLIAAIPCEKNKKEYNGIPFDPLMEAIHQKTKGKMLFMDEEMHPSIIKSGGRSTDLYHEVDISG